MEKPALRVIVGISQSKPVEIDPDSVLREFGVFHDADGDHFVGFKVSDGKGRISTPITSWDPETRVGTTHSGRRYQLVGEPAADVVSEKLWDIWCAAHGIASAGTANVTTDYVSTPAPRLN